VSVLVLASCAGSQQGGGNTGGSSASSGGGTPSASGGGGPVNTYASGGTAATSSVDAASGGSQAGAGGTAVAGGGVGAGGATGGAGGVASTFHWGPRCTDCATLCIDPSITVPDPLETCTAPSAFAGLSVRFDLVVTLPDGSNRYLVDSPFDYNSDHYPSWSYDNLGTRWYRQKLVCGEVALSNMAAGSVDPQSTSRLSIVIDGTTYSSTNANASVTLVQGQRTSGSTDPVLGPIFDFSASGALVSAAGATIQIEGHMRNVSADLGERGLESHSITHSGVAGGVPTVTVFGSSIVVGPVVLTAGTSGVLQLNRDLGGEVAVPLSDVPVSVVGFSDGALLGIANQGAYAAAFETGGSLRWQSPSLQGSWLMPSYQSPLARSDGSGCWAASGPSYADSARPAMLGCTTSTGSFVFQQSVYPVIDPLSLTELADGTITVLDSRSPALQGIAPNGTRRFALSTCTAPASSAQIPYYSMSPAGRNADGGGVAQIGDDIIAFAADGTVRWRSAVPRGSSEPLVAADGTIYAMTNGTLVALAPTGDVKWTSALGADGSLIGLTSDGTIYAATWGWLDYGLLCAVTADGRVAWSTQSNAKWVLAPEGDLYGVETSDALDWPVLLHVRGDSPMAEAPWPAPRGSSRRSGTR